MPRRDEFFEGLAGLKFSDGNSSDYSRFRAGGYLTPFSVLSLELVSELVMTLHTTLSSFQELRMLLLPQT
eukprot:scaffold188908_cov43-Attheya_sp.AAC.1